jgi:peptide/nickel transport system substrate-binding protein
LNPLHRDAREPRKRRRALSLLVLALALALAVVAAGCGGDGGGGGDGAQSGDRENPEQAGEARTGGTFRVGIEDAFEFTGGFDPTGEYLSFSWSMYRAFLVRTLLTYNLKESAEGGNELHPDLATDMPEVSEDGLTYTFTLKDGIRWAPPLDREITSDDVLFAFERIGTPDLVAQYGLYYNEIEGMAEFQEAGGLTEEGNTISGIETPDDKTIVFTLTEPVGDFPFRLAMPATGPMPREVAGCFMQANEYGRYLISSGPYMLEGTDDLDISNCQALKASGPISGYQPDKSITYVRNPNYDQATDEIRSNYPDRFEFTTSTNLDDILNRITRGDLETTDNAPTPQVLAQYSRDENLKNRLFSYPADGVFYMSMNLTQPPFDDINVRKAVNAAMDKRALQRVRGGPIRGDIATHVVANSMFNDELKDYDPFPFDRDQAKQYMSESKYDTDGDGMCDAPECKGVLSLASAGATTDPLNPIIEESFASVGIELTTRSVDNYYPILSTVSRNVPFSPAPGWFKDYPDAFTFVGFLFDSRGIPESGTGNYNYSLVGVDEEQGRALGARGNFEASAEANVDDMIDECKPLSGEERVDCWIELDKHLTENVVAWIPWNDIRDPYIVSENVTNVFYDQSSGSLSWSHVALKE